MRKRGLTLAMVLGSSLLPRADAQGPSNAQLEALARVGVTARVIGALRGTEAEARDLLGEPSGEKLDGYGVDGPEYRELRFGLSGGTQVSLIVCADDTRRQYAIDPEPTFCEARVETTFADFEAARLHRFDAMDIARPVANSQFGECDNEYYVLGGLTTHFDVLLRNGNYIVAAVLEPTR